MIDQPAFFSSAPEEAYSASVADSHRKRLGQFFTPPAVAAFMANWIVGNPACRNILDPAVGLGMFLRAILNRPDAHTYQLLGYDIDSGILERARALFSHSEYANIQLLNNDYLFNDWDNRYDGIICNPPYLKFQHYKNRAASLREFQSRLGMTLGGLTNIYSMFLLKSATQLAANGRAAYIVPLEFLNADYGTAIKSYLLKSKTLRYVIIFDSDSHVFDNALTTSCILLLANDQHTDAVTFIDAQSVADLSELQHQLISYPHAHVPGKTITTIDLDPSIKWRAYYQRRNSHKYSNLVPLSTYGKIVRGIATGDNEYFTFDERKKQQCGIPDQFLLPCITKSAHADTYFFTQNDFNDLRRKGKRVWLLNATETSNPAVREYISLGETLGANTRYLTSHRNPWYALEHRPPAPILVTVFNRNGLRFVRNEANVRNLTCFHSFYINILAMHRIDALMAYLMTDVSREILNDDRREYGGGLKKFEPNDLNQAKAIDLETIDLHTEKLIVHVYHEYRASILQQRPDQRLHERLNDLFFQLLLR